MDDILALASEWLSAHCEERPDAAEIIRRLCDKVQDLNLEVGELEDELNKRLDES